MPAIITFRTEKTFKIEVEIPYSRNMLDGEECLQRCLNEAGAAATKELLERNYSRPRGASSRGSDRGIHFLKNI